MKDTKPQKNKILLSVVIATYNGAEYIERCLESFTQQSLETDLFEVIIVNNNSTDQTLQLAKKYTEKYNNFVLINEDEVGVSFARNKGINFARGKYICFIDDDAYANTNWLKNIKNVFEIIEPTPAAVGGQIFPYYKTKKPKWFNDQFEIRTKGNKARFLTRNECFSGFPESNFSVQKEILNTVGNFSTDYGPKGEKMIFGEGTELSIRIAKVHPYFWYDPDVVVYHLVRERNMNIKYILSRKYQTAYLYQKVRTPSKGLIQNVFIWSTFIARIILNAFLSVFFVRWFTKNAINDWLKHIIPLVNCTARSIFILEYYFIIKLFNPSGR